MNCYGARVVRMGDVGKGQQAKMCNQICIAGLVQGLSEALNFAIAADLDTDALLRCYLRWGGTILADGQSWSYHGQE